MYPFGLYEGEPGPIEILERKSYHTLYGPDHLAIKKVCPACNGNNAVWVRQHWAICYDCELAFDCFERYYDLTESENPDEE